MDEKEIVGFLTETFKSNFKEKHNREPNEIELESFDKGVAMSFQMATLMIKDSRSN